MSKEAAEAAVSTLVYCIIHISQNDVPEFPSAALLSIDDATASSHSSALQSENSFCVISLKVDGTVHWCGFANGAAELLSIDDAPHRLIPPPCRVKIEKLTII